MARVEADRCSRVVQRREHLGDLLEPRSDAPTQACVVFDEQSCFLWVGPLQHLVQVLDDVRQPRLEPSSLVRPGVKDHAVYPEIVSRLEVAGKRALRPLPHGWIVACKVDQVDGVKVERRIAMLGRRLFERRYASFIELGRAPEAWRRRVDLNRFGAHGRGALEGEVEAARGIYMGTEEWHAQKTNRRCLAC